MFTYYQEWFQKETLSPSPICLPVLYILISIFQRPLPWTPNSYTLLSIPYLCWMSDRHLKLVSKTSLLLQPSTHQLSSSSSLKLLWSLTFVFYIQIPSISKSCLPLPFKYIQSLTTSTNTIGTIPHHLLLELFHIVRFIFFIFFKDRTLKIWFNEILWLCTTFIWFQSQIYKTHFLLEV